MAAPGEGAGDQVGRFVTGFSLRIGPRSVMNLILST